MSTSLDALLRPFEHKSLKLRNRVAMAPMTRNFSPDYIPNEDVAAYYRRRAEGEVGLIITEGTTVGHVAANGYERVPAFHGELALAGWKRVVDQVHQAGGAIIPQLWHVGAVRRPGIGPDKDVPGYSPSGLFKPGKESGHAMTLEDIDDVIRAFAESARNARDLGFDGVEIHGAHGYLLDQFFWEGTNQRDDQYGGNMDNRGRFVADIVRAVREAVGEDFAIVLRYSQWKQQDYEARLATTPQELERFLTPLVDAGVDLFHASTRRFWVPEFEGSDLNLAGWTRKLTGKPTLSVGSVGLDDDFIGHNNQGMGGTANPVSIDELERRMANDEFDLIAVGRALLQDPNWLIKMREGREEEIEIFTKKALGSLS
ncbi:FMN-binding oxidoreductase [Alcanivorax balearicus MACL04]|uniref:FMN-binding oxidoreductase n=1 Tax=Alloalcanivorax balearicus MACL04 TaxID=1177182 RepID=A0ABT2QUH7_9GAMM|nr:MULTISPECIES: NADH:flavin oxidoreductase [Alloalcanivorax]MCE7525801.1 NADH:flavin oxidoreductase [Alloalcanivorax xenomutans]MCU5781166.1 FMN-binding oxidoreductase [Alloalcanivorax balearicus MACL04]